MSTFFGYIRVSTGKQQDGVSLYEQQSILERYAQSEGITISRLFVEVQTAAKAGRPLFTEMLKLLKQGRADGVLIHKIDRGSRNAREWAQIEELWDKGYDIRFVGEGLRGDTLPARLAAGVQAAVAQHYIRNLREETRKGFYGRLKQGLYPLPAPTGYLDRGKKKPKEPDPDRAPLIGLAFDLYATGEYGLIALADELYRRGLRNRRGGRIGFNQLARILHNPFYMGVIRLRRKGETFPGIHPPLVSKAIYDRVQAVLTGKGKARTRRHAFRFRGAFRCASCGRALTGELQKGRVYYRCHSLNCPLTSVREDSLETSVRYYFRALQPTDNELLALDGERKQLQSAETKAAEEQRLKLRLTQITERLDALTDAYLDRAIDRDAFETRKASLLMNERDVKEQLQRLADPRADEVAAQMFELMKMAESLYDRANDDEKRDLLRLLTSNREVSGNTVVLTPHSGLASLFADSPFTCSSPMSGLIRTTPRTDPAVNNGKRDIKEWLHNAIAWVSSQPPGLLEALEHWIPAKNKKTA